MSTVTLSMPLSRPALRPRPPVRLTARGRAVFGLLLLLLAGSALALVVPPSAAGGNAWSGSDSGSAVAARVTVDPGQTLWQIAATAVPHDDPRATIERIKDMNGLRSSAIEAGQVLLVPIR